MVSVVWCYGKLCTGCTATQNNLGHLVGCIFLNMSCETQKDFGGCSCRVKEPVALRAQAQEGIRMIIGLTKPKIKTGIKNYVRSTRVL